MKEKEVYLLRHADTGLSGRYVGITDAPLSEEGVIQSREVCVSLSRFCFPVVLCSPLRRCVQTVESLQAEGRREYHDFLREINFGLWENKTFAEILDQDRQQVELWLNRKQDFVFPGGDSIRDFRMRVRLCAAHIRKRDEQRILVVTHGGVIRHLLCEFLSISQENYLAFDIRPGHFSTLQIFAHSAVLTGFNLKG
ncbi:MAG: hypothetical protein CSB23_02160 [Deltaproteobacteria bacterium]|nr:MAG: hypothetical protein CSB23_02160 [Deltaproteobacteria bacterium]